MRKTLINGFAEILRQIKNIRKQYNIYDNNLNLTFVGDRGEEFKYSELKKFLMNKYNAVIYNIGIASKSKVGGIERIFR